MDGLFHGKARKSLLKYIDDVLGVPPILGNPHMGSPRLATEMTAWVIRLKWSLFGLRSETITL